MNSKFAEKMKAPATMSSQGKMLDSSETERRVNAQRGCRRCGPSYIDKKSLRT